MFCLGQLWQSLHNMINSLGRGGGQLGGKKKNQSKWEKNIVKDQYNNPENFEACLQSWKTVKNMSAKIKNRIFWYTLCTIFLWSIHVPVVFLR